MRFSALGSTRRRAIGVAAAAALLGGGVTGCGTEAEAEPEASKSASAGAGSLAPAEAVARAAEKTADITSLRYRVTGTLPEHGKVRAEASMGVQPSVLRMELTGLGDSEDKPLEVRFVDGAIYARGDTAVLGDTTGRRWVTAEPAAWGGLSVDNQSYRVLPRQLEGSPLTQSTLLTGAKDVTKTGTETVDGTRTTHYQGTVTGKGLRATQGAAKDKRNRQLSINNFDQFMALGLKVGSALAMDLWVDEDGRAKQFRMRGETSALDSEGRWVDTGPLDMTVTFLDVDPSVTVEPPAAGDTVDLGALVDARGAG
ncbi:hypothetical protein SGFS_071800 [Streptomyces graminofaciens]|uniref:Lipoprotein n=1 Tax=Streptomyces graminofaciens TaxID=68212 RepID=A0ABM7FFN3_9ACTN|nr:hypothetical protein [Streptomyces graminofaciens]BBC35886.1 hypothetical protein SGFS_071800 [Streptomyces graminofaciens]